MRYSHDFVNSQEIMLTEYQKVFIIRRYYEIKSIPMVIPDNSKEFKLKGISKDIPKKTGHHETVIKI